LQVKNNWGAFFRARDYVSRYPTDRLGWKLLLESLNRDVSVNLGYFLAQEFERRFSPLDTSEAGLVSELQSGDRAEIAKKYHDASMASVHSYVLALDGRLEEAESVLKSAMATPGLSDIPSKYRSKHDLRVMGIQLMKNSAVVKILQQYRAKMAEHKANPTSAEYINARNERHRIQQEFEIHP
jgi:hypothetical protein